MYGANADIDMLRAIRYNEEEKRVCFYARTVGMGNTISFTLEELRAMETMAPDEAMALAERARARGSRE
jgi:hypothetical protein